MLVVKRLYNVRLVNIAVISEMFKNPHTRDLNEIIPFQIQCQNSRAGLVYLLSFYLSEYLLSLLVNYNAD